MGHIAKEGGFGMVGLPCHDKSIPQGLFLFNLFCYDFICILKTAYNVFHVLRP